MTRPFVTTFYSFKGGVGRTLLAANAAVALANHGKTLFWDLDVEAPGVHHIPALGTREPISKGYFSQMLEWQRNNWGRLDDTAVEAWDACLATVKARPELSLLPAAASEDVLAQYTRIDWSRPFATEPRLGLDLFDQLLDHWGELGYRWVVIDSRTGLTDLGALLTALVPDQTVLVGNFGQQNTAGLRLVWDALQAATGEHRERVPRGRQPLVRQLVASPVPTGNAQRLAAGREVWAEKFKINPSQWLQIDEHEDLRFSEYIAELERADSHRLVAQYRAVADKIMEAEAIQRVSTLQRSYPEHRDPGLGHARRERRQTFAERIEKLLDLLGYAVERGPQIGDTQVDLIASNVAALDELTYFVECDDGSVGIEVVEKVDALLARPEAVERGARGMIIAPRFTPAALSGAKTRGLQCYTPQDLEDRLFDFGPYLAQLRSDFEQSRLSTCYVTQYLKNDEDTSLLDHGQAWSTGRGSALWVLLGDYGTGKTAFTQRFAYHLAQRLETDPRAPIPLLINLRDYPNKTSLESVLEEHLVKSTGKRGRSGAVLHLIEQGRVVLLLDSFDEMGTAAVGVRVAEQFRQLAQPTAAGGDPRVLITCREEFFREQRDVEETFADKDPLHETGSQLEVAAQAFQAHMQTLAYFNQAQVAEFLRLRLGRREGEEAFTDLGRVPGLSDLATRPQLLEIVLESLPILANRAHPVNAGLLYETYVLSWLEKHRRVEAQLSVDQIKLILEHLAQALWVRGAQPMHYNDLFELVKSLRSTGLTQNNDPIRVDLELRTAAFLVRSPDGYYRFSHRSFLEYFFASRLRRLVEEGDEQEIISALSAGQMRIEVVRMFDDLWRGPAFEGKQICRAFAPLLTRATPAAGNLFRMAWWLACERARTGEDADQISARRDAATISLPGGDLQLAGVDLQGEDLDGIVIRGGDLAGVVLDRASLRFSHLESVQLAHASLDGTDCRHTRWGAVIAKAMNATNADFRHAALAECDFSEADFRNADLRYVASADNIYRGAELTLTRCVDEFVFDGAQTSRACATNAAKGLLLAVRAGVGRFAAYSAASFDPAGQRIVSAGDDQTIRIWDAQSGQCLRTLEGHEDRVFNAQFDPAGRRIVSAGRDATVRVWDADSGASLGKLEGHRGGVLSAQFDDVGGRIVSAGDDRTLRIWDAQTGACLQELTGHGDVIWSAQFDPTGNRLVSASHDESVRIWELSTGACLHKLEGHGDWVRSAHFDQLGERVVSAGDDNTIKIWDVQSGQCLRTLEGHGDWVRCARFDPSGRRIVSAGDDRTVRIWDADAGTCLHTLAGHGRWIPSAEFDPEGQRIVSAGADSTLRIWDAGTGTIVRTLEGQESWVLSARFDAQGERVVSTSIDQAVSVWDAASGERVRTLEGQENWLRSAEFDHRGERIVSGGDEGTLSLWDATTGQRLHTMHKHEAGVSSVQFHPSGRWVVSASLDQTIGIWDTESGTRIRTLEGHEFWVLSVQYDPGGQRILSASRDKTLRIWDADTGDCLRILEGHLRGVHIAQFDRQGQRIVSASSDQTVRIWDAERGECLHTLEGHGHWVRSAQFDAGGLRIVSTGDDCTVRIWDAESGQQLASTYLAGLREARWHGERVICAADGLHMLALVSQADGRVELCPIWQSRVTPGGVFTGYPDNTHAGDLDALEWLEYEAVEAPPQAIPLIFRATDLAHLRREYAQVRARGL
ncbi:MAG: pentapeptide repeat-containing protein [Pseudomonadota bacterium]